VQNSELPDSSQTVRAVKTVKIVEPRWKRFYGLNHFVVFWISSKCGVLFEATSD